MVKPILSEQDEASMSGPRDMKTPGGVTWCWQTVSALQFMWKSLNLDYELYQRTWNEAESHRIWEKIPPDNPYGTKEAMLERLKVGDEEAARARVAAQAIPARAIQRQGVNQHSRGPAGQQVLYGSSHAEYLTARIARDRPDIWERMKNGEFTSVAAAAREAGIVVKNPRRVVLNDDVSAVVAALKRYYSPEQFIAFGKAVGKELLTIDAGVSS